MFIKNLILKNYRNYDSLNITFNDKLNIFIGDNAQGKTNILESIYVLSLTKSYLSVSDRDLIKFNNSNCIIKSKILKNNLVNNFEIRINQSSKKVYINDKEIRRFKDYISKFNIILFSPENIRMIKDGPSLRRKFLNIEISQILNKYVNYMIDFNYILKQRNEILKKDNIDNIYFEIINNKFIDLSIFIYRERNKFINCINKYISDIYYDISGDKGLKIRYICDFDLNKDNNELKEEFLNKLIEAFDREKKYGNSLYGPHKDDFRFFIDDKDVSIFGSQGQMRMSVLSLKLSEINVFKEYTNVYPILLLDDIFSELDIKKRNNLIKYFSYNIQTIITTTDLNMIDKSLLDNAFIFNVNNGNVTKEGE